MYDTCGVGDDGLGAHSATITAPPRLRPPQQSGTIAAEESILTHTS